MLNGSILYGQSINFHIHAKPGDRKQQETDASHGSADDRTILMCIVRFVFSSSLWS